tara:strand:+ start:817 stop:1521 length:705 start_codon:yes stop_codon:yes gene_type:complete
MKKFSIIIPIFNEEDSILKLLRELYREFKEKNIEILVVDDGSTDNFKNRIELFQERIRIISHKKNLGKCRAMLTGVENADSKLIGIIDGDGQNPPKDLKKLFNFWGSIDSKDKDFFLVCGNRKIRQDTLIKKVSSKYANYVRKMILKDECDDTACALKIFRKTDYLNLPYFKNMHRFLPSLFKMKGGKIFNIKVNDRQRFGGRSKYNFNNRFWVGIRDLLKVWYLVNCSKRRKR